MSPANLERLMGTRMPVRAWHIAILLAATVLPVSASAGPSGRDGERIRVVYVAPKTAAYREIYDTMREQRVLERVGAIIGLVRLPNRLTYRLTECAGERNAWYAPENRSVTVCYELLDSIVQAAPRTKSPAGVTRQDAIHGPVFQILLHESSHLRSLAATDPDAQRAIDLFVYRIERELGSLVAALGGLDALIFTGGIGENDVATRAEVLRGAAWAGFELDAVANASGGPQVTRGPGPAAWVIPADEEMTIARGTCEALAQVQREPAS